MSAPLFRINNNHLCLVIGKGLIGAQVIESLIKRNISIGGISTKIYWDDPNSLINHVKQSLEGIYFERLDIIWSAGRAGFSSSDTELKNEFIFFRAFLQFVDNLDASVQLHHISSVGGLYEGVGYVCDIDQLSIQRPYAKWKYEQEKLLSNSSVYSKNYRISSVYGISKAGNRKGLINTLINNSLMNKPVRIFGSQNTLRDYIYNVDIGNFIASQVDSDLDNSTSILASGRAISVDNLIRIVEKSINKRIYVEYAPTGENSRDIIFSPNVIQKILSLTTLEEGIKLLCLRSKSQ